MGKNPDKIVGNSGRCFKCNEPMYCREKEYQGTKSPQWQDKEGKSHYSSDGSCKGGSVQGSTPSPSSTISYVTPVTTKVSWVTVDKSPDMEQLLGGLESMISLAYESVKKSHAELDENGTTFGQIVNARTGHLIALATVKATKENKP